MTQLVTAAGVIPRRPAIAVAPPSSAINSGSEIMAESINTSRVICQAHSYVACNFERFQHADAMVHPGKSAHQRAMGVRLRLLREALGLTQAQFGETASVGATTIAGWESGRNMIDLVHLSWSAETLGFSIDYVARNDLGGLRHDLAIKIQALARAETDAPVKRRGRPRSTDRLSAASSASPLVRVVPDDAPLKPPRVLHEPIAEPVSPVKTRVV